MANFFKLVCVLAIGAGLASPALAHHALGGDAPITFGAGFLSGLAHPVINFNHFAFVIAVGVLTAVGQASKLLPIWFVTGSVVGTVLAINGLAIPYAGWIAHVALIGIGLALALGHKRLRLTDMAAFAVAGVLHGSIYADAVVGTIGHSLTGYLLGFAIVQMAVAIAAMMAVYMIWEGDRLYANARVVGGFVAGVGLTVLAQSGAAALFPLA